jgi:hypothetical protein
MARLRIEYITLDRESQGGGAGYPNTIRSVVGAVSLAVTGVATALNVAPAAPVFEFANINFARLIADADMVVAVDAVATPLNSVYVGPRSADIVIPIKAGQKLSAITIASL